jgi:pimeloyl-ACP methyl ester carboxylesterase
MGPPGSKLTVRYPERVSALVLCRPAWLDRPQDPWNQRVCAGTPFS